MKLMPASLLASLAMVLSSTAPATTPAEKGWTMVWSDEFDGDKIDPARWSFDVDCWGGANNEDQCYTSSRRNAAIEDGKLVITARNERVVGPARLSTRGKAAWRYGKIEVHAKLPPGQGTWPAIWMLPERDRYGSWAASGEIDILEAVNLGVPCANCPGGRENMILGTLHFGGKMPQNLYKGEEVPFPEILDGRFHTYTIEWYPDRMIWQVDGRTFAQRQMREWSTTGSNNSGAPFDQPF